MTIEELVKQLEEVGYPTKEKMETIRQRCEELNAYVGFATGVRNSEDTDFVYVGSPLDAVQIADDAIQTGIETAMRHFRETHPNYTKDEEEDMQDRVAMQMLRELVERYFNDEEPEKEPEPKRYAFATGGKMFS